MIEEYVSCLHAADKLARRFAYASECPLTSASFWYVVNGMLEIVVKSGQTGNVTSLRNRAFVAKQTRSARKISVATDRAYFNLRARP